MDSSCILYICNKKNVGLSTFAEKYLYFWASCAVSVSRRVRLTWLANTNRKASEDCRLHLLYPYFYSFIHLLSFPFSSPFSSLTIQTQKFLFPSPKQTFSFFVTCYSVRKKIKLKYVSCSKSQTCYSPTIKIQLNSHQILRKTRTFCSPLVSSQYPHFS